MAAGLGRELWARGPAALVRDLPSDPIFLLAFAAAYLALPVGDWIVFRRLWRLPAAAGLGAAIRKRIANEVLFGYSGEAYFYAWARARARAAAPFAAVKDAAILSALAGNAATLALAAAAWALAGERLPPGWVRSGTLGAVVVAATSLPFLLFRGRVFSLPAPTLRWVFGVHLARVAAATSLMAWAWSLAAPGVGAGTWAVLAAARLGVSRLPLLPNKDLLFANLAVLLMGSAAPVATAVAVVAAATLATHALLTAGFGLTALARRHRTGQRQARTAATI